jgi:CHASE3 domain sensor protein
VNTKIIRKMQEYFSSSRDQIEEIIQVRKSNITKKLKSHRNIIVLKDESQEESVFTVAARNG